ncbi:hypothetical protein Ocin01_11268 [Orchesella cincta]|uniref:Uncharacterized protein n=1 Tax=Orchesella cincta TaxID=48709 RepID=A0A1D2MR73_ORCCI|nr:hypothetical protein Ocin01_11268 [Orchesella cincta]
MHLSFEEVDCILFSFASVNYVAVFLSFFTVVSFGSQLGNPIERHHKCTVQILKGMKEYNID